MSRENSDRRQVHIAAMAASWLTVALAGNLSAQTAIELVAVSAEPVDLLVDVDGFLSNGIFEPGERVLVAPFWMNAGTEDIQLSGAAARLEGPAGATYTVTDGSASYDAMAPGATASCLATGDCYQLEVIPSGARPMQHWDTTFTEVVSDVSAGSATRAWTVHLGGSFTDVPVTHRYYRFIETILHNDVTGGCGGGQYCPSQHTTRAEMAVLVLASAEVVPPACESASPRFVDVPASSPFCPWIEEAARRGIVSNCVDGPDFYCPDKSVRRRELAQAVVAAREPFGYEPSACTGTWFQDVDGSEPLCAWIEALAPELAPIIPPPTPDDPTCSPEYFCPADFALRGDSSVFLVAGFGMRLYQP